MYESTINASMRIIQIYAEKLIDFFYLKLVLLYRACIIDK